MSQLCQITGKRPQLGHNVSHSNIKTRRKFYPNLSTRSMFLAEENRWVTIKVSAAGLRVISKNGLKASLEAAKAKGYITHY